MKQSIFLFFLISVLLITGCRDQGFGDSEVLPIQDGQLDLSDYDLVKNAPLQLNGEWEFYWEKLLSPADFENNPSIIPDTVIEFPSYWNNIELESKEKGGKGYATYRLVLLNTPANVQLAIKMRNAMTSYKLWINNELLLENGRVGKSHELTTPGFFPDIKTFQSKENRLRITLQIANFSHAKGGMRGNVMLGTVGKVNQIRERKVVYNSFLFGAIFIMSVYHFGLFYLFKKDRSTLYFGLLCFFISLRILSTGEILLNNYIGTTWEILQKIEYVTFIISLPIFLMFVKALYHKVTSSTYVMGINAIAFVLLLLTLFTKSSVFSHIASPYQYLVVLSGIYVLYVLIQTIRSDDQERSGALIFLMGYIVMFGAVVHDVLYYNFLAHQADLSPLGLVVFIVFQSFLLSKRNAKTSNMIEDLNSSLKQKVVERTLELEEKNKALEQLNKEKDGMIGIVAHDLKAPFNKISGFSELIRLTGDLSQEQREYMGQINHMVDSGVGLIHDVLDMNAYSYDDFQLNPIQVNLRQFFYDWKESYLQLLSIKDQSLHVEIKSDVMISLDINLFTRIMDNLLSNAIKFSQSGKNIWITVDETKQQVRVKIRDEGPGFSNEDKGLMFRRFQRLSARPTAGEDTNGLGLSIIKTLVSKLNAQITLKSELGNGAEFIVLLNKS
jgi:signal transduction histidine kinase